MWLLTSIVPFAYAAVVAKRHSGFSGQPCLVLSRDPATFASRLGDAGGPTAVKSGVLFDIPFAALLGGAFGVIIAAAGGPWWVVLPAVALDFLEGRMLWGLCGAPAHSARSVQVLFGIAVAKFAIYGLSLIATGWAAWMLC